MLLLRQCIHVSIKLAEGLMVTLASQVDVPRKHEWATFRVIFAIYLHYYTELA